MRRIYLILSLIILFSFIYLIVVNFNNNMDLQLLYSPLLDAQTKADWTEQGSYFVKTMSVSLYTILVLIGGFLAGAGIVYMFLSLQNDKVKAYQRELEKSSISGANNASRVEVLEAKIQTLEKAFSTVVDERTQLEIEIKSLNAEIENMRNS